MKGGGQFSAVIFVFGLLLALSFPTAVDSTSPTHLAGRPLFVAKVDKPTSQYNHCSTQGTTLKSITQSDLTGDFTISQGQSYLLSGRVLNMQNFNFLVDGGVLIVNNSILRGHTSQWEVQRGSCVEITNSRDYVSADSINVGGSPPPLLSSADLSRLYINNSTMLPGLQITGRDVTVRVVDSFFQDNIFFNGWVTLWPVESGETNALIVNSIVPTIVLAFGGSNQGADIPNLRAGYFSYWNLHQNLTVFNLPYDLTLNGVTLIPNSGGEGNLLGGGWGLQFVPGGSSGTNWPSVTVTNSVLGLLTFFWYGARIPAAAFSNLGLPWPTTQTIFDTIRLVNTTVEGFIDAGCTTCNLTFNNVRGMGVFPQGKSNITFVNSWTDDAFQPQNCYCTVTFVGNSSLGRPGLIPFTTLPYYRTFPNASWWQSLGGSFTVTNSYVRIYGNYTDRAVGPGFPVPGSNTNWTNSTGTRTYPVFVIDQSGKPVGGADLTLTSTGGFTRHYTTGSNGRKDVQLSFKGWPNQNFTNQLMVSASSGAKSGSAQLGLASTTPFILTIGPPPAATTKSSTTSSSTIASTTTTTAMMTTTTQTATTAMTTTSGTISTQHSASATTQTTATTTAGASPLVLGYALPASLIAALVVSALALRFLHTGRKLRQ